MWRNHRGRIRVRKECAGRILLRIADCEWNLLARCVQQRLRHTACVADRSSRLICCELVSIGRQRLSIVLKSCRAFRVTHAMADSNKAENYQRRDLNYVDRQVDRRRSTRALRGNPAHKDREENRDQRHEQRSRIRPAHRIRIEEADHISNKDTCRRHHHAGINPVIKVRAPANNKLGHAGILEGLILGKQRLLRVVVTRPRARIEL